VNPVHARRVGDGHPSIHPFLLEKIMGILNLTQHPATAEQIAAGVVDLPSFILPGIKNLLTFEALPTNAMLRARASALADYACRSGHKSAMIGGAPYFMRHLEEALIGARVRPLYAFSLPPTVSEVLQPDGSVKKVSIFRHGGFVGAEFAEWPESGAEEVDDEPPPEGGRQ
jgi:hypothetical protein